MLYIQLPKPINDYRLIVCWINQKLKTDKNTKLSVSEEIESDEGDMDSGVPYGYLKEQSDGTIVFDGFRAIWGDLLSEFDQLSYEGPDRKSIVEAFFLI